MTLYDLTGMYLQLQEMMEDPDIDPQLIQGSMESLNADIEAKADGYGMIIRNYEAISNGIDAEIKRLQGKKKTCENAIKRLKNDLKTSMIVTGNESIRTEKFLFTVRAGSYSVVIDDEKKVPKRFREPQPDKILTADLKAYLKENGNRTYAHLKLGEQSLLMK